MSLYILDTDTLTLYERSHSAVLQRVRAVSPTDLAVTIISVEEQLTGWYTGLRRARRPDDLARVYDRFTATMQFMAGLRILSCSLPSVLRSLTLRGMRLNVGTMDLRIAAIALEHSAIVVTRNARDFGRVPGLTIEDWSV